MVGSAEDCKIKFRIISFKNHEIREFHHEIKSCIFSYFWPHFCISCADRKFRTQFSRFQSLQTKFGVHFSEKSSIVLPIQKWPLCGLNWIIRNLNKAFKVDMGQETVGSNSKWTFQFGTAQLYAKFWLVTRALKLKIS